MSWYSFEKGEQDPTPTPHRRAGLALYLSLIRDPYPGSGTPHPVPGDIPTALRGHAPWPLPSQLVRVLRACFWIAERLGCGPQKGGRPY